MSRPPSVSKSLLVACLLLASFCFAEETPCPTAKDRSLPKAAGVYMRATNKWVPLSNPKFWQCRILFLPCPTMGSNFMGASFDGNGYLSFKNAKASRRTNDLRPLFLVRGHSAWKAATVVRMDQEKDLRMVPIRGEELTKRRLDAKVDLIEEDLACVKLSQNLMRAEYVPILTPDGSEPSIRDNFWDFAVD